MASRTVESGTRRSGDRAHRDVVDLSVREVTAMLAQGLGWNLLAFVVGRKEQTVRRWAAGDQAPPLVAERVLRDAFQIFRVVEEADGTRHVARSWFIGMNPQLDDVSPAEALQQGRARDVIAAARAYVTGG